MKKNDNEATVICVLGMHRSGTSMISRIINVCGVYVGSQKDLLKSADNKFGHWEHKEVLRINKEILSLFGDGDCWDNPPNFPNDWIKDERLFYLKKRARAYIEDMSEKSDLWGFKDPRVCLTLPFWQDMLPDMIYIIPIRSMGDVVKSLQKRNKMSQEQGMHLWSQYWVNILKNTQNKKKVFTYFDDYFDDYKSEMEKISQFINHQKFNVKSGDEYLQSFISPGERHSCLKQGELIDKNLNFSTETKLLLDVQNIEDYFYAKNIDLQRKNDQMILSIKEVKSSKFWKTRECYMRFKKIFR